MPGLANSPQLPPRKRRRSPVSSLAVDFDPRDWQQNWGEGGSSEGGRDEPTPQPRLRIADEHSGCTLPAAPASPGELTFHLQHNSEKTVERLLALFLLHYLLSPLHLGAWSGAGMRERLPKSPAAAGPDAV